MRYLGLFFVFFFTLHVDCKGQTYDVKGKVAFVYKVPIKTGSFFKVPQKVVFETISSDSTFCYTYFVVSLAGDHKIKIEDLFNLQLKKVFYQGLDLELRKNGFKPLCESSISIDMGDEFYLDIIDMEKIE